VGVLNLSVGYRAPRQVKYKSPADPGPATSLAADEKFDWLFREQTNSGGIEISQASDSDAAILITGRNWGSAQVGPGLSFALRVLVVSDGRIETRDGGLRVRDARHVMLQIAAATSYVD